MSLNHINTNELKANFKELKVNDQSFEEDLGPVIMEGAFNGGNPFTFTFDVFIRNGIISFVSRGSQQYFGVGNYYEYNLGQQTAIWNKIKITQRLYSLTQGYYGTSMETIHMELNNDGIFRLWTANEAPFTTTFRVLQGSTFMYIKR